MASNATLMLMLRTRSSARWLSTSTAPVTEIVKDSLYRKLTALGAGASDAGVAETLDECIKAKNRMSLKRFDIINCVNKLRKSKKYHHAIQLYKWMETGNTKNKLNNTDRAILIDLLAKTDGIASAEKYFNSLEKSSKTKKTYGALLRCYCNENMLEKGTELFEKMREMNLAPTVLNYNNLMSLYLKSGHPEKVFLLAQEMEEKKIADLYTYNQLMNSYASVKDYEGVEKVMEKMRRNGIKRDWFTFGNLATIYVNAGLVDKANAALEEMEKIKDLCDHEAFHTLITLYARISDSSGVNRAWKSLKLARLKTSNVSFLVMLLALSKLGDVDGLEKLFREWESGCSTYDIRVCNVVLESYLNRDMIEEANLLYESAVKRGAEPNFRTLDLFMNFYLKKRQMDLALKYLETGVSKLNPEKNKWFPNEETVSMFLRCFEEKDTDSAEKFFEIMKKIDRLDMKIFETVSIAAGKVDIDTSPEIEK